MGSAVLSVFLRRNDRKQTKRKFTIFCPQYAFIYLKTFFDYAFPPQSLHASTTSQIYYELHESMPYGILVANAILDIGEHTKISKPDHKAANKTNTNC